MQVNTITPAENLLRSLQKAEKFSESYDVVVEKSDAYTCLHLRFSPAPYETNVLECLKRPARC